MLLELKDEHKRPTLWDINHIDLKRVATEEA